MPRLRIIHHCVRPRWTCGSSGMVDEGAAMTVACQEEQSHAHVLRGVEGASRREAAQDPHALYGIAYELCERPRHWEYLDLITGESREIGFAQWRIEDYLIRGGYRPSVAREAALKIMEHLPGLRSERAQDVSEGWEKAYQMYIGASFQPDDALKRAARDAAFPPK